MGPSTWTGLSGCQFEVKPRVSSSLRSAAGGRSEGKAALARCPAIAPLRNAREPSPHAPYAPSFRSTARKYDHAEPTVRAAATPRSAKPHDRQDMSKALSVGCPAKRQWSLALKTDTRGGRRPPEQEASSARATRGGVGALLL
eukprot:3787488-Prymnesium_polylepis.1